MAHAARPRSRDGFTIAVLCALPREANAVMALLDEEWEDAAQKYGKSANDDNSYTFGLLGGKPIVLAYASMGKVAAANVSKDLTTSFSNISLLLVVGVCGGAPKNPETNVEVQLGDIIISTQVIQGDFGRVYERGFERKTEIEDTLGRASREIRGFVTKLSTLHAETRITKRTNEYLINTFRHTVYRKRFHCPAKVEEELSKQQSLQHVALHFGRIMSTDSVIKSAPYRDDAILRERAVAFEMESAGTWENAPTLLVKGVCDYADSSKNKDWQDFAALSAASCAKAIAQEWVVRVESRAETVIARPQHTVAMYTELLKALKSINPDDNLMEAKGRTRGVTATAPTCEWVLESKEFKSWAETGHDSILVISGEPGIGKTTMATVIVDRLREGKQNSSSTAAYFFVNNRVEKQRTVMAILRSLMYQILARSPHLCEPVQQQFDIFHDGLFEKFTSMWPLFRQMLSAPNLGEVYLVVDALDECEEKDREELIRGLCSLLATPHSDGNTSTKMKFLVLTRPNLIAELLGNHVEKECHIQVGRQDIKDDLEFYIEKEVERLVAKRQWNDATHEAIQNELRSRHGGTFLWVALVMKNIAQRKVQERDVLEVLTRFPSDLSHVYARILEEINETEPDNAPLILRYVLASDSSSGSLSRPDAAVLLHFSRKAKAGHRALPTQQQIYELEAAVKACELLLRVDQTSLRLELLHQSIKEFFEDQPLPAKLLHYRMSEYEAKEDYHRGLKGYLEATEFEQLAKMNRALLRLLARRREDNTEQVMKLMTSQRLDHIIEVQLGPLQNTLRRGLSTSYSLRRPAILHMLTQHEGRGFKRPRDLLVLLILAAEQGQFDFIRVNWSLYTSLWAFIPEEFATILAAAARHDHRQVLKLLFDVLINSVAGLSVGNFMDMSMVVLCQADDDIISTYFDLLEERQADIAKLGIGEVHLLCLAICAARLPFLEAIFEPRRENTNSESQVLPTQLDCDWAVFRYEEPKPEPKIVEDLTFPMEDSIKDIMRTELFTESRRLDGPEASRLCNLIGQFKSSLVIRRSEKPDRVIIRSIEGGASWTSFVFKYRGDRFEPNASCRFSLNLWRPLDYALDLWRAVPDERRRAVVSFLARQMRRSQSLSDDDYRGILEEFEGAKGKAVIDRGLDGNLLPVFDKKELLDKKDLYPEQIVGGEKVIFSTKAALKRVFFRFGL